MLADRRPTILLVTTLVQNSPQQGVWLPARCINSSKCSLQGPLSVLQPGPLCQMRLAQHFKTTGMVATVMAEHELTVPAPQGKLVAEVNVL